MFKEYFTKQEVKFMLIKLVCDLRSTYNIKEPHLRGDLEDYVNHLIDFAMEQTKKKNLEERNKNGRN